jgi:hypothetical protein
MNFTMHSWKIIKLMSNFFFFIESEVELCRFRRWKEIIVHMIFVLQN